MMAFDVSCHLFIQPSSHHSSFLHVLPNLCGTDIIERRIYHLHGCRKRRLIKFTPWPAINQNTIFLYDFVCMIPSWEPFPIVCTNHQHELMFRIGLL